MWPSTGGYGAGPRAPSLHPWGERARSLLICSVRGIRSYARRVFTFTIWPKALNSLSQPPCLHQYPQPNAHGCETGLDLPQEHPLLACALDSLSCVYSSCFRRAHSSSSRQAMAFIRLSRSFSRSVIWAVHFASDCDRDGVARRELLGE